MTNYHIADRLPHSMEDFAYEVFKDDGKSKARSWLKENAENLRRKILEGEAREGKRIKENAFLKNDKVVAHIKNELGYDSIGDIIAPEGQSVLDIEKGDEALVIREIPVTQGTLKTGDKAARFIPASWEYGLLRKIK